MTAAFDRMVELGRHLWKPKGKPVKPLSDLTLTHLTNIVPFLKRKIELELTEAAACAGYSGGGDMADMYAGHAMDHAFDRAAYLGKYLELIIEYVALREEHGMLLSGPKPALEKT